MGSSVEYEQKDLDRSAEPDAELVTVLEQLRATLSKALVFDSITVQQVRALVQSMKRFRVQEGEVLFAVGDSCSRLFVLEEGETRVTHGERNDVISNNSCSCNSSSITGSSAPEILKLLGDVERFQEKHGSLCTSTAVVTSPHAVVWSLDRETYIETLRQASRNVEEYLTFLRQVPILSDLNEEQLHALGNALTKQTYEDGDKIVCQGEMGDTFYFVLAGKVVCQQKTVKGAKETTTQVNTWTAGDYFGEGALFHDAPRDSDAISSGNTVCLLLRRKDFNQVLSPLQRVLESNFRARVLNGVDLLAKLTESQRREIASSMVYETFQEREMILKQGDHGDKFYIIKEGVVMFTRYEEDKQQTEDKTTAANRKAKEIGRLFVGQYFGEGALLTDAPRRASAFAVGRVTLLSLHRTVFAKVFNDESLQQTLNRDFEKRRDLDTRGDSDLMEFGDLEQILVLGAGTYGQVLLVTHKVTGGTFALKCMSKGRIREMSQEEHVQNEKSILQTINHPFVVNLVQSFTGPSNVYALLEAVLGGELFALMRKAGRLKLKPAMFYIAQVVLVFEYLHKMKIVYRDLKPENLLLTESGYLKCTDFGLAKILEHGTKTYTLCGTPAYAAPEIYNLRGHGFPVDWWALGVLTHELLAGMTPFSGDADGIFKSLSAYAKAYPNIKLPKGLNGYAGDFVLRLLNPNPNRRLGSLSKLNGAKDCKCHGLFKGYNFNVLLSGEADSPYTPKIDSIYDTHNFYDPVMHDGQSKIDIEKVDLSEIEAGKDWVF